MVEVEVLVKQSRILVLIYDQKCSCLTDCNCACESIFYRWVRSTHLLKTPIYSKHPYHTMTTIQYHTTLQHTTINFGELFTLRLIHFARYMRLTKRDKVKHMLLSLDVIHFGELFILGWIHFARYMRLTKGDKVKHPFDNSNYHFQHPCIKGFSKI